MRPSTIVVANELLQDQPQVPLVDWNQIIQAFAPTRSDESFEISGGLGSRTGVLNDTLIEEAKIQVRWVAAPVF
jgi:hypothetical protein